MIWRLKNFYEQLQGMLWFLPGVLCLVALILASVLFQLETTYFPDFFDDIPFLYQGSNDDAKRFLVVLLSSMITMTTLAVSVTIVLLSLASSQLGPRLIKYFMSDKITKIYIGLFFSAIVSCFAILWILYDAGDLNDAPSLTVSYVAMFCFANLFVLLFFVHHVAESCIADNVVVHVSSDLMRSIERLPPADERPPENYRIHTGLPEDFDAKALTLFFSASGYIQAIDNEGLVALAEEKDLIIEIGAKVGEFVIAGQGGIRIYPGSAIDEVTKKAILRAIIQGAQRTPTQDIEYSLRHLVEIALRALSPGINDPYTAVTVIDHLFMAMAELFNRRKKPFRFYDTHRKLRLRIVRSGDAELVDKICTQIRQAGNGRTDISLHLLNNIRKISPLAKEEDQRQALLQQVKAIKEALDKNLVTEDYEKIAGGCRDALQELSQPYRRWQQ